MSMTPKAFDWEYYTDDEQISAALEQRAKTRLLAVSEGHTDLIGASVAIETLASGESTTLYQARVVAFMRPENVAALEKADSAEKALRGALAALERQVRERREKLGQPWQRPDMGSGLDEQGGF